MTIAMVWMIWTCGPTFNLNTHYNLQPLRYSASGVDIEIIDCFFLHFKKMSDVPRKNAMPCERMMSIKTSSQSTSQYVVMDTVESEFRRIIETVWITSFEILKNMENNINSNEQIDWVVEQHWISMSWRQSNTSRKRCGNWRTIKEAYDIHHVQNIFNLIKIMIPTSNFNS